MIVDAWVDEDFRNALLERARTTDAAESQLSRDTGLLLERETVVISEDEYNNDYTMQDHDEVVFVLPNHNGRVTPGRASLFSTRPAC